MSKPVHVVLVADPSGWAVFAAPNRDAARRAVVVLTGSQPPLVGALTIGARRLWIWPAAPCTGTAQLAVVTASGGVPTGVYLAPSEREARRVETALLMARAATRTLRVLQLSALEAALDPLVAEAPDSVVFCPRCKDHPLHDDPILDETDRRTGQRICRACGMRQALDDDRRRRKAA